MAAMNEKDYYAVLEVDEGASTEEIRRAFQKKARKLHPDVNKEPDAEERFKEVSEAYAVLSDESKRKRYDAMRSGMPFVGAYSSRPTGGSGYSQGSPFASGFPFGGSWTGGQSTSRSYRPRAGADILFELDLDADAAEKGVHRGVTYQRYTPCNVCHGMGSVEHTEATTCPTCGGAGRMRIDLGSIFGFGFFEVTCPECEGSGAVVVDPCTNCGGTGRVLTATEIVVEVPENSHDGDEIRAKGMGNAGTNGRESGDFVCEVRVAEERLTPQQESGFRMAGIGIPILVLGLFATNGSHLAAIIGAILLAIGLASALRDGIHMNTYWWRQVGSALAGGAISGLVVSLLLSFLVSGIFLYPITFLVLIFLFLALTAQRPQ